MTNNQDMALPTDVSAALRLAAEQLAPVSDTARLDAELLMAHALHIERSQLLLDSRRYQVPDTFSALLARRMAHEPLAYITGHRDFWTLRFAVGPGALIPRPDSETLMETMLDAIADKSAPLRVLDLGTGPGTLLLSALTELPAATGLGVDASEAALSYARQNAADIGLESRVAFQTGYWGQGVDGPFDIILCNPPYIADNEVLMADVAEFEPASALFAGADGLQDYRILMPQFDRLLSDMGIVILEIGYLQRQSVSALAEENGFSAQCLSDLGGRDRVLLLRRDQNSL